MTLHSEIAVKLRLRAFYFELRGERPEVPARTVWAYVNCEDPMVRSLEQFMCNHEWSSGYDETDHEIAIYCLKCGASGDV